MSGETSVYPVIGRRIRQLRERKGWSQTELGARLPRPATHHCISYYEHGKRRLDLDLLGDLAWAFGLTVPDLLQPLWDEGYWL